MEHKASLLVCLWCTFLLTNGQDSVLTGPFKEPAYSPIVEQNNHKPVFTKCLEYNPEVAEGQERGAHVIQVHADEQDPESVKGGKITYSIIQRQGVRVYFTINNVTGEILTNAVFDRDEPTRQKELYLTVQATDDGRPPLADICTIKVTVTDINDNTPVIDQLEYNGRIVEDQKVKSEIMRVFAYDFDDGENARLTYGFTKDSPPGGFNDLFRIDPKTGVVYLESSLQEKKGRKFSSIVSVHDNGTPENTATAEISFTVIGSDKKAPTFTHMNNSIELREDFYDVDRPLIEIKAESNLEDKSIAFRLTTGKTTQTNKDNTFGLSPQSGNTAVIFLARGLDYETVPEYQLTVQATNKDSLDVSTTITVKIIDVNDEIPTFIEVLKGSVVENGKPGAPAMSVRAIDKDGTFPFNDVHYALITHQDLFEIDNKLGLITSKKAFDRETESIYYITVQAYDGAPSAILRDKTKPNSANQTFTIDVEDQNDNPPKFETSPYIVKDISEGSDRMKTVLEVKAIDKDTASLIEYSIIQGNIDDAFLIESSTGRIKVNTKLDFEKIESYNLTVQAFDGTYNDTTQVIIYILNENDELPIFEPFDKDKHIQEEQLYDGCIYTLKAYDPDIKNRSADQHIIYRVGKEHSKFLKVDNEGCVMLISKLDRDLPDGSPQYQGFIQAYDNDGLQNSLENHAELNIILDDINDNAPFLTIHEVVWYENQMPGVIVQLTATDYDGIDNGAPFTYNMDASASEDIHAKFYIESDTLNAQIEFDREQQKFYDVPISITDSGQPPMSGVSILRVIIGDRNDNAAMDGSSEIFVYKYEKLAQDIEIGRVYVNDPDDWDLPDKVFQPKHDLDNFYLHPGGMIVMRQDTPAGKFSLLFQVTEEHEPLIERHTVTGEVAVTVKIIPEEAVRKSGSIRLNGTTIEQFIERNADSLLSRKDLLQAHMARVLNTSLENVDVFTVLNAPLNHSLVDVRFSAHGSPYYAPERLNNKVTVEQETIESELGAQIAMVSINECVGDAVCRGVACTNTLQIRNEPAVVFTNRTSFVGVQAVAEAVCECGIRDVGVCYNNGTPTEDGGCVCPDGFDGAHCESVCIGFDVDGWAMYQSLDTCNSTAISLNVLAQIEDGLIFYAGPLTQRHAQLSRDFISLEVRGGYIVLKMDLGNGTFEVVSDYKKISDGAVHKIKLSLTNEDVQIEVDDCPSECLKWFNFPYKGLLNINGPLLLGGRPTAIFPAEETKILWDNPVTSKGFRGTITNFTYNGFVYNLGVPGDSYHAHFVCNFGVAQAVTFGIDTNFLVAILVCIAILLILLLAVVVHKRKQDNQHEKDMDDTRENIINYEDEGGGERDTDYDLTALRAPLDEKPPLRDNFYKQEADVPKDICQFLKDKKHACDKDNSPYDDVRHYGYEGDGNSTGSLSSLASCTDEGDLKFNYLSSFGPRFRKLADMYGDDASEGSL